uniref:Type I restriction enzyme R protein N terminus (HSDR_N) n=1 Tax=Candidatus Kentrum sp. LPFa TaxID=2126335 RepID=A0A450W5W5_9GAMM|nr:MAG: hypothetical protein BECKLPF1236B_GA0070989_103512 [Candidatus Kentron sp. LPFa]
MPFSDYKTISQVQTRYDIRYQESAFIKRNSTEPSKQFAEEVDFTIKNLDAFSSEAARCELIILPVLRETYKNFYAKFSLWVQRPINYDATLNGTPDYIVSKRSNLGKTVLEYPLVMIAEAKKNDFEQGWAQCLAELVAAQKINEDSRLLTKSSPRSNVYGIVTDGKYWEFGALKENVFTKNSKSLSIDDLPELFGGLNHVFSLAELEISQASIQAID